jgi:uncharacterized protein (UPF0303 family)
MSNENKFIVEVRMSESLVFAEALQENVEVADKFFQEAPNQFSFFGSDEDCYSLEHEVRNLVSESCSQIEVEYFLNGEQFFA